MTGISGLDGLPKKAIKIHALHAEALSHLENGRVEKAISNWNSALKLARKIEDWGMVISFLLLMGQCNYAIENYNASAKSLQEALNLSRFWNKKRQEGRILVLLGKILHQKHQHVEALKLFNAAINLAKGLKDRELEADAVLNIGLTHRAQNRLQQSNDVLRRALKLYRRIKKPRDEAFVLFELGKTHRLQGKQHYNEALQAFEQAHRLARKLKETKLALDSAFQKADLLFLLEKYDIALESFDRLLKQAKKHQDLRNIAQAHYGVGKVLHEKEAYAEARPYFELALKIFESYADEKNEAFCLTYLSKIHSKSGNQGLSKKLKEQAKKKFKMLGIEITD